MAQVTSGLRRLFSLPTTYDGFQALLGAKRSLNVYVKEYVQPSEHARVLDIGCGTSQILAFLPKSVLYAGYDLSDRYIEAARKRYGLHGEWYCTSVSEMDVKEYGTFDVVMANGVFHHLDDDEARRLSEIAAKALKPTGRFCSFDGCYIDGQNPMARYLISKDRGLNVRDQEGYRSLVRPHFDSIELSIRHDMLRIPYTHAIIVAQNPRTA